MTAGARLWTGNWLLAASAALLPCAAVLAQAPPPPPADAAAVQDLAEIVQQDLQKLAARLNDPNARQEDRDEAARRLISRQNPDGRRIVAEALVNLNPGGQLAAARALADDPNADPTMINPLFAALGTNRQLNEAVVRVLSGYKDQPEVVSRLIEFVQRRPPSEATRVLIIRAIGSIPDKRSAAFLVAALRQTDETPAARAAAGDALAELTGLPNTGQDPQRWQQWWAANSSKSEAEFRSDLLSSRSARYDQLRQQLSQFGGEVSVLLKEQYRAAAPAQRLELLLRYLRSTEPQVRVIAAGIILEEALDNKQPAAVVLEQLREMIGDSSAAVRGAVAEALGKINDAAAFEALLAQLSQEPDPAVRASLARALGPINDVRAAPVLVAMLSDPNVDAAMAAAGALAQLGAVVREKDPALARRTAEALRDTLEKRAGTPETADFRKILVDAMVPLRDESLRPLLTSMLDERRGESVEVRQLAIRGIGEIANPESSGLLLTALDERSDRIRLEAAQALAKNPALGQNAEALRKRLDPQQEPEQSVRDAAWRALESAFPSLPKAQLQVWADRFKGDPARRLSALKALAQQQVRDRDEDGLATTRDSIGVELMALQEYRDAAEYFGLALEYKKTQQVKAAAIASLRANRMKALLASRDFPAAVAFAGQTMKEDPTTGQDMGTLIWIESQQLQNAGEFQAALDLITAAKGMTPPLSDTYREKIADVEREIQKRKSQQNGAEPPPGPRSAASTAPANRRSASGGQ